MPSSKKNDLPCLITLSLSGFISTKYTVYPAFDNNAAVESPTYPAPMIVIICSEIVLSLPFFIYIIAHVTAIKPTSVQDICRTRFYGAVLLIALAVFWI